MQRPEANERGVCWPPLLPSPSGPRLLLLSAVGPPKRCPREPQSEGHEQNWSRGTFHCPRLIGPLHGRGCHTCPARLPGPEKGRKSGRKSGAAFLLAIYKSYLHLRAYHYAVGRQGLEPCPP